MTSGLLAALELVAAEETNGIRHFEIADGFALTLIALLFLVLTGVGALACAFRQRERRPSPEAQALRDAESDGSEANADEQSPPDPEHAWEREADWWKRNPQR